MAYDDIEKREYGNQTITYGTVQGNKTLVFIKTGRGGTVYGENENQADLYVKLSNSIHDEYGYTVVVSDNPEGESRFNPLDDDMKFVNERFFDVKIIYVGYSAGANYGAWFGHKYGIERILLINPKLNMNPAKLDLTCQTVSGPVEFALGEYDESFTWADTLPKQDNVKTVILKGQDHHIEDGLFIKTVLDFLS